MSVRCSPTRPARSLSSSTFASRPPPHPRSSAHAVGPEMHYVAVVWLGWQQLCPAKRTFVIAALFVRKLAIFSDACCSISSLTRLSCSSVILPTTMEDTPRQRRHIDLLSYCEHYRLCHLLRALCSTGWHTQFAVPLAEAAPTASQNPETTVAATSRAGEPVHRAGQSLRCELLWLQRCETFVGEPAILPAASLPAL